MIQFVAFIDGSIGSRLTLPLSMSFPLPLSMVLSLPLSAHAAFSVAFIAASVDGSLGSRCLYRACKLLVSETYA